MFVRPSRPDRVRCYGLMSYVPDPCDHRSPEAGTIRPTLRAKQITIAGRNFFVRGVTYGTFRAGPDGTLFPPRAVVECDFAAMARHGFNTVRTYCTPPVWLLDLAHLHGLYVMAGVAWPQHLTFLDRPDLVREIEATVRADVRACAGHRALLCHVVGNEIPTAIVRWHGARAIERFLDRLVEIAR